MTAVLDDGLVLRAGRHPLAAEVSRGLDRAGVPHGTSCAVAASGGADSTALLALVAGIAARGRVRPVAVHVDHGLRPESGLDADCAGALAARLGLGFRAERLAVEPGPGLPERAREARYSALSRLAAAGGEGTLLLAHHADDQLETMLLALARGAGLSGIGGMPARRVLAALRDAPAVTVVRPCLRIRRGELRAACSDLGLAWREDPGNARIDTPRGAMRHVVLPALEAAGAGASGRAARTAELARLGWALLESHVHSLRSADGSIPRASLRGAPEALAATAAWILCGESLSDAMRWNAAEAAVDGSTDPRRFPLAGGGWLLVDAHAMRVEAPQGSVPVP